MKKVKCVVFDLDNTIWSGIMLEDKDVYIKSGIREIIIELDHRGILLSIASKGNESISLKKMQELKISDYFLYPQINWDNKYKSICEISRLLNIGIDTIAFIDDDRYELLEMSFNLPEVECISSSDMDKVLLNPRFISNSYSLESEKRRVFYIADEKFRQDRAKFNNNINDLFLTMNMKLNIEYAESCDNARIIELLTRTNKLNSIGEQNTCKNLEDIKNTYGGEILKISYSDKYFDYGVVGFLVLHREKEKIIFKIICFSCRMLSRNICYPVIQYIINNIINCDIPIFAEMHDTKNNGLIGLTLKGLGFKIILMEKDFYLYELKQRQYDIPCYLEFINKIGNIN